MGAFSVFLIRLLVSIMLAFLISRIFFQGASVYKILGLAAIMFVLAYLFEYTKRKDRHEQNGT
jgi:FtsH-binding integral membrane protein